METKFSASWQRILADEIHKDYFIKLMDNVDEEYANNVCYPPKEMIFNAFKYCDFNDLMVVIIGQDPYHGKGEANGLAFSVANDMKRPPSLQNIFTEICNNDNSKNSLTQENDLQRWAKQGVLLLNATLTVRENEANSHKKLGWNVFTKAVLKIIADQKDSVVFILWGNFAQTVAKDIEKLNQDERHLFLKSGHPSFAYSHKKFFGQNHFNKANEFLTNKIEW